MRSKQSLCFLAVFLPLGIVSSSTLHRPSRVAVPAFQSLPLTHVRKRRDARINTGNIFKISTERRKHGIGTSGNQIWSRKTPTTLHMSLAGWPQLHGSSGLLQASSVLVLSSLTGCWAERKSSNTGILTTMALASLCSNVGLVPSQHYLYDLCWTTFLPASLAFLLLGGPSNDTTTTTLRSGHDAALSGSPIQRNAIIRNVGVSFLFGSIGSILGCMSSFFVFRTFPSLGLAQHEAAVAASCLCASFIGGTVNFFATANVIGGGDQISTLMSSMAAADLIVMGAYFASMALLLKSTFLSKLFAGDENQTPTTSKNDGQLDTTGGDDDGESTAAKDVDNSKMGTTKQQFTLSLLATTLVTSLALFVVKVSTRIEKFLAPILPGTACAVIAVLAPVLQQQFLQRNSALTREMQKKARLLAEFCLQLLFASIGTSAKLGEALIRGPGCLVFSLVALAIHIVTIFAGSWLAKSWFRLPLLLEDILIASNAAIGGPATAAGL